MLITDQNTLNTFCRNLEDKDFITVDTEFLREKTYYPKLCLIQIGDPHRTAAAIDPLEGNLDLSPIFELMLNDKILKIFHAGRQDLEILYRLMNDLPCPYFDTQIAAMVCGYGDSVGYEALVRNITGNQLDKSVQFTDWSRRPLSQKQIDYALGDVTHIVDVYKRLSDELKNRERISWVYEEEEILTDPATYQNEPQNAWKRIKIRSPKPKMLAILRELAAWREIRAQEKDLPRPWIMRDDTLVDIAAQAPKDSKQLSRIRNLSKDLANGHIGRTLIGLVKKAENSDKNTWPQVIKRKPIPPTASATLDILKMLLKIQSTKHGVAGRLIASKEELEALSLDENYNGSIVKGWRYDIFGKNAVALKEGNIAIGLKDAKITKYKISSDSDHYE
ncbi:MAG: ribonuclease D [Alphaproteobacteria bacterium]|nr:ribonuclease D [Alphaproteobacteria bacterium]